MQEITNKLSMFSAWAVSITAIMAMLTAVFKPIRAIVSKIFQKIVGKTTNKTVLQEVKKISNGINDLNKKIDTVRDDLNQKIQQVSQKNDANEKDRLRSQIFKYGNYCRKGQLISGQQYSYIRHVYQKYISLKGNSIAAQEYNFIKNYYDNKGWKKQSDKRKDV